MSEPDAGRFKTLPDGDDQSVVTASKTVATGVGRVVAVEDVIQDLIKSLVQPAAGTLRSFRGLLPRWKLGGR